MTELSTLRHADEVSIWALPRTALKGGSMLDHLFNRLDGMYPGKWKANFPNPQSIENWKDECARVFDEEGITPAHIGPGLKACRRTFPDWPPSVPQFANACLPPIDPIAAYHEAVAGLEARGKGEVGNWSHPGIYWAASKLSRDLMSMPSAAVKERWSAALKAQMALGTWEPIPGPRLQLPAPGASMLSKEDAARMLAQLGAVGLMRKPSDFDHLRWARVILDRQAAGDPKLTISQIKSAREALGITRASESGGAP